MSEDRPGEDFEVRIAPNHPERDGERGKWDGFVKSLAWVLDFFTTRGAKAADATVEKMQAEVRETDARARNINAETRKVQNEVLAQVFEQLNGIIASSDPPELKRMKLRMLAMANPELQHAFEQVQDSMDVITLKGAVVKVKEPSDVSRGTQQSLPPPSAVKD